MNSYAMAKALDALELANENYERAALTPHCSEARKRILALRVIRAEHEVANIQQIELDRGTAKEQL